PLTSPRAVVGENGSMRDEGRRSAHMPPHDVVECVIYSSQAVRGENLQVEHPICGWYSSAFHFHPTLASGCVTDIGGICLQGFDVLFRKEPVAFVRFEALTDHFCVHFCHQLPRPNVKTETERPLNVLYEV